MLDSLLHSMIRSVLHLYWRMLRPSTRGARAIVVDEEGEVLLVKHSYGSQYWYLPGGGVKRGESPEQAVRRELYEELEIRLDETVAFGQYTNQVEGKIDTVHIYSARIQRQPTKSSSEIAFAQWFPLDQLPVDTSPATRRRLREFLGMAERSDAW